MNLPHIDPIDVLKWTGVAFVVALEIVVVIICILLVILLLG